MILAQVSVSSDAIQIGIMLVTIIVPIVGYIGRKLGKIEARLLAIEIQQAVEHAKISA